MSNKPKRNDALEGRLSRDREITITVSGRKSGRTISLPICSREMTASCTSCR
jgi:hypothetical protein